MIEPHKFVPWDDEPSLCFGHGFYGCAKPKDDPIHQQESQRYMVHLWNASGTGIECGIEAGTVVSKSRIAEVDCAECITSLNSQMEPHKFEYCEVAHCDCGLCGKCSQAMNDQIHQQEGQPEHWCDKHQAVFSYNVVYGIRHYVCTQCFVDQPVTQPAEAPEGLRAVEAFYKGQIAQAQQRIEELERELAGYKEEPCPKMYSGHWFDSDGICTYCDKYDEENNLRLKERIK